STAVALFDSDVEISCISKRLINRLKLDEIDCGKMKIASFGDRNPETSVVSKASIEIKITDNELFL
uniref:DUF1758 domain-containing protein n=1 Tax=Onchocerca volvulus TaxID=6282 RepID=A0A8R1TLQ5_ONCVO